MPSFGLKVNTRILDPPGGGSKSKASAAAGSVSELILDEAGSSTQISSSKNAPRSTTPGVGPSC